MSIAAPFLITVLSCRPENERGLAERKSTVVIPGAGFEVSAKDLGELERAALAGDAEAAVRLSNHYTLAMKDEDRGFHWLEIAARNGDATSQYNWGFVLHRRHKDEEAAQWFRRAIDTSVRTGDASTREAASESLREIEGKARSTP